jgi:hypothetical protein
LLEKLAELPPSSLLPKKKSMKKKINRRRKKTVAPESLAAGKAERVIKLTRCDALVRQLDSAIRMWFLDHDPVPIHLLLLPAYDVLHDLGKKSGNAPDIESIRPQDFRIAYDWLRHASSDLQDFIDFPLRTNEFLLWVCTSSFEKIFGPRTVFMMTFQAYFVLWLMPENPKFREGAKTFLPKVLSVEEAITFGRLEFFVKLNEMFAAQVRSVT